MHCSSTEEKERHKNFTQKARDLKREEEGTVRKHMHIIKLSNITECILTSFSLCCDAFIYYFNIKNNKYHIFKKIILMSTKLFSNCCGAFNHIKLSSSWN